MSSDHVPMRLHVGVAVHSTEAAVVIAEHRLVLPSDPTPTPRRVFDHLVHEVLRPPANVEDVADLLAVIARDFAVEQPYFLIVPDRQGSALYRTLAEDRHMARATSGYASSLRERGREPFLSRRWPHLLPMRGKDQQRLLDALVAAQANRLLHIAPDAVGRDALAKALKSFDPEARDDRYIAPLVAATAASLYRPRTGGEPRVIARDGHVYGSHEIARGHGTGVAYG